MEDKKFYATICNNHNVVIHNLQQMKKLTNDVEMRRLINESLDFVRHCKKQGQRMENRMALFNNTICNVLGYKRVRKEKKEWD